METEFTNNDNYKYQKAKDKVEAIKGFYGNLIAYCIVIPILAYINYNTTSFPWAIFPALGWGFGLTMNGLYAFGYNPFFVKNWEERKIKQYMQES
ncbi:2TM domain-containing protein [Maribacter sp. SA7]|uniref:2TM domain-containing protein n=1 Tax=Maribacter zhoushanensis TaxID=3030012 RepID=UPI0023EE032E|nr:2TM domain-containing protein [Maribacter zhoushanensis]MDF4202593.1 2TM domain-containing protein [Maribacter zhoushanensis]